MNDIFEEKNNTENTNPPAEEQKNETQSPAPTAGSDFNDGIFGTTGEIPYTNGETSPNREPRTPERKKTLAWSIAALACGCASVVCCCIEYAGLIFGVLALVFVFLSRRELGFFDGMTIAGMILAIFGIVFGVASLIAEHYLLSNPEFIEAIKDIYKEAGIEVNF